jgi:hypothetical protein
MHSIRFFNLSKLHGRQSSGVIPPSDDGHAYQLTFSSSNNSARDDLWQKRLPILTPKLSLF